MADMSIAVEYDRLYPVDIKHPITGESMGITVNVVSKESRRVVKAQRELQGRLWDERALAAAKNGAVLDDDADTWAVKLLALEEHGIVSLAASIDSWDWGEHSFEHISGSGPATLADAEFFIRHNNSQWMVQQVAEVANRIENFSQALPKSARTGSKKK